MILSETPLIARQVKNSAVISSLIGSRDLHEVLRTGVKKKKFSF
jgi:hypothetical protein